MVHDRNKKNPPLYPILK